jgi:hypothetical protein
VNFHRTGAAHYVVTTWSDDPDDAARLFARLVIEAIAHPALEVDVGLPPRAMWGMLGTRPAPQFQLRMRDL